MKDNSPDAELLLSVRKPSRYAGGELGACASPKDGDIRFLFAFPDLYEVGMSHLGTTILYALKNATDGVCAERCYAPAPDMAAAMQKNGIPLCSLETGTPAREFDFIGFNLSYELCYTTVLMLLRLAGLPVRSKDRDGLPIVLAGGACTYNPEPLADFVDIFIIGEGEEVNLEVLALYRSFREAAGGFDKQAFLRAAAEIEGVYVPALYEFSYNDDGTLAEIRGKRVKKRFIADFDKSFFPEKLVVPFCEIVHDRVTLEVFRGCTRGCRFCQAGMVYRPVRERSVETIVKQARTLIDATGYDEISLSSLSTGDYSQIDRLTAALVDEFEGEHVGISLPSLRVDSFSRDYAKRLQLAGKSSLTFAPEAGTQRLRDVINKNITEDDILSALRTAFESGCTTVKLYFMVGLPTETTEDLDGIAALVNEICGVFKSVPRELRKGSLRVNVSTACFVPKPCTPFQWEAQDSIETLEEKQRYLAGKLRQRNVKYSWHEPRMSYLEAVLANGGRKLCDVIEYASERCTLPDAMSATELFAAYTEAFAKAGVDADFYARREKSPDELLPYEHIDCLVDKAYLLCERRAAFAGTTTPDCREGCTGCGMENCPNM